MVRKWFANGSDWTLCYPNLFYIFDLVQVNAIQMSYHVDNLDKKSRYEFWVNAHTAIGEGAPSVKVIMCERDKI